ncbi:MAG: Ni/Fe hydrogenase subunit alpha [gamma proteobacterium symbiont of Bathyaustriella thionipta]|nr:Ni/Fe hydrogenase subunit alpha [gamma proteobacterium symbiont of Bathyaustriella thionipta]MCU7951729.1 Ni/Fe hydrogenase subunit alpha [gamma proteobacterium symbiont of Bathyaustriella thionipta]MCU7958328.1 Ni/Fe hydrogenase subunit alpha [gamma proteobacterium symbiont of Bathyaustriella thionipta]MCU7968166.1 Ni/Fe hydrogenase subunit alpha [gamma proteobacterium symbiont of Bathyaustriella thionipta]
MNKSSNNKPNNKTVHIKIDHVTRLEGHGSILINVEKGQIENLKLEIVEANRFFENLVLGMPPHDVPQTVSRICGICYVGHQLAAIKAVENALNLTISPQTRLLRKLLNESQFLQSHALHLYFLAIPDYVGVKSILPLASSHPELIKKALKLKKLANDFTTVLGGRALHPMMPTLIGWRKLPDKNKLDALLERLHESLIDIEEMIDFIGKLTWPDYERQTEYVSLKHPDEYALYEGKVFSSDTGQMLAESDYRSVTNEFTVPHSTAKWSRWNRESYMVGALARVNNNFSQLHPQAQAVAHSLDLSIPCYNPYKNNLAQMVEIVHCTYHCIEMLELLLGEQLQQENLHYQAAAGIGASAIEVPRGILFHEYGFDQNGICNHADAVISTSQNINNIERDMNAFVPKMLPVMQQDKLAAHMEMLLRAYDPCISCSVHMLDVTFV